MAKNRTFKKTGLPSKHQRLYYIWKSVQSRCRDKRQTSYEYYGDRGIKVCDEWLGKDGFEHFINWAYESGYDENAKRGECTLDRIDSNGDYCPENCRWVSMKEQSNNTRRNRMIEYKGEVKTLAQWVETLNLNYSVVLGRMDKRGWSVEKAFETPVRKCKKRS